MITTPALALPAITAGSGPPLIILHGLFGQSGNWSGFIKRFAQKYAVHALDLRNHGDAPHDPVMSYAAMAGDVAAYIEAQDLAPAHILGHSMGGKAAMALALTRPALCKKLIVADIAPVAYRHGEVQAEALRAMMGLDLAGVATRAEANQAMAADVEDKGLRQFLLTNLQRDESLPEGWRWRLNLPVLKTTLEDLMGWPTAYDNLSFEGEALILRGGLSRYVQQKHHATIRALFPKAEIETIENADHWLHVDQPAAFIEAAERFLR